MKVRLLVVALFLMLAGIIIPYKAYAQIPKTAEVKTYCPTKDSLLDQIVVQGQWTFLNDNKLSYSFESPCRFMLKARDFSEEDQVLWIVIPEGWYYTYLISDLNANKSLVGVMGKGDGVSAVPLTGFGNTTSFISLMPSESLSISLEALVGSYNAIAKLEIGVHWECLCNGENLWHYVFSRVGLFSREEIGAFPHVDGYGIYIIPDLSPIYRIGIYESKGEILNFTVPSAPKNCKYVFQDDSDLREVKRGEVIESEIVILRLDCN